MRNYRNEKFKCRVTTCIDSRLTGADLCLGPCDCHFCQVPMSVSLTVLPKRDTENIHATKKNVRHVKNLTRIEDDMFMYFIDVASLPAAA